MRHYSNRPHPRSTAAVRNTEGFVQIQVTDIRPKVSWTANPNLRVHICPVHINLSTMAMNNGTDFLNLLLKNAVGRRIGHHQGSEFMTMLLGFNVEVIYVHVAHLVTGNRHHLHPAHHGTSRIGSVG